MDMPEKNTVRELPQTFNAAPREKALQPVGQTYRAKVFQSGNSLALRLPKALGLEAGMELDLTVAANGEYRLAHPEAPKRKLDVGKFWGKAAGMVHVPEPRQDFEPRPSTLRAKL